MEGVILWPLGELHKSEAAAVGGASVGGASVVEVQGGVAGHERGIKPQRWPESLATSSTSRRPRLLLIQSTRCSPPPRSPQGLQGRPLQKPHRRSQSTTAWGGSAVTVSAQGIPSSGATSRQPPRRARGRLSVLLSRPAHSSLSSRRWYLQHRGLQSTVLYGTDMAVTPLGDYFAP